jgi:hypothetical protein
MRFTWAKLRNLTQYPGIPTIKIKFVHLPKMRKIYITLCVLLVILAGMSYLYFSGLNAISNKSDLSLRMASRNAAMVFSIQNNKSVLDLLKVQELFNNLIGRNKVALLDALKSKILSKSTLNDLIADQNIYISVFPGSGKNLDLLLTVQLNSPANDEILFKALQTSNINLKRLNSIYEITLSDSIPIYLGIEKKILVLSTSPRLLIETINSKPSKTENLFIDFIGKHDRMARNSLASLYINYNKVSGLLKAITPHATSSAFAVLNKQDSFAHLSYNFSKERIFFNGETTLNDVDSYYTLFTDLKPEKILLDKDLPSNTASYALYCLGDYAKWHKTLNTWFSKRKEDKKKQARINDINAKYHLNLDDTFPKYASSQFVTFQLTSKEKLAAISLSNGDKLSQLLLDLSDTYAGEIKLLKESDLFYYYFGEPLANFKRPYYVIVNNVMFLSNTPASLTQLLSKYNNNDLLIQNKSYTRIFDQLPNTTSIIFYINNARAQGIAINTLHPTYYPHLRDPRGLKIFDSFIYQLSGDKDRFQTNLMLNTKEVPVKERSQDTIRGLQDTTLSF